jgi:glycosyltransferase involved in cell wall biosynthesis
VLPSVIIITPLFPPMRGSLADHSCMLAERLSARTQVSVLTSTAAVGEVPFTVRASIGDWSDPAWITAELSDMPSDAALVWQYVPSLYGRGGVNPALPRLWRSFHEAGQRQIIVAHEVRSAPSWHPVKRFQWWRQTKQFDAALTYADAVALSTELWVLGWRRIRPAYSNKLLLLPSPSSVTPVEVDSGHRARWRHAHGLPPNARILAWYGGLDSNQRFDLVVDAWRAAHSALGDVALVLIGVAPNWTPSAMLRPWYKPLGFIPAAEVSAALHAADVLACPFSDGISERRASFMAGLAHGVPVVGNTGHNTGPTLRQAEFVAKAPHGDNNAFFRLTVDLLRDDAARSRLGLAGLEAYRKLYSWPVILDALEKVIELPAPGSVPRGPAV